jgi:hypothetical protein
MPAPSYTGWLREVCERGGAPAAWRAVCEAATRPACWDALLAVRGGKACEKVVLPRGESPNSHRRPR